MRYEAAIAAALSGCLALSSAASAEIGSKWSYDGKSGPEHWSELSPDFALCKSGRLQSPIDMAGGARTNFTGLSFDYPKPPSSVANNGHTIQLNFGPGNSLRSGNKTYELLQIHLHSPSEHSVDGRRFPMEIHLVHRAGDGSLAVVGVLVANGEHHMALHRMQAIMPVSSGTTKKITHTSIGAKDFLPDDTTFVRYVGSLTTPPCSENVHWHVMSTPIEASQHQFDAFLSVIGENARPVQPTADRLVLRTTADSTSVTASGTQGSHSHADH